ncbi:MAG: SMI1/KNR4 family protein [Myxococcota bacterium]
MTVSEDIVEIGRLLDEWAVRATLYAISPPLATRVGELNPEGWGEWKMLPSPVTPADVEALEADIGFTLPQFYRAFLQCRVLLDLDFGDYTLPWLPPKDTLADCRDLLSDDFASGFRQFGTARGAGDPLCFDLQRQGADGDYPIVVFNHDVVPHDVWKDPARLRPYVSEVSSSFRQFLPSLLDRDESMFPPPQSPEELRRNAAWAKVHERLKALRLPSHHRPDGVNLTDPFAILDALE